MLFRSPVDDWDVLTQPIAARQVSRTVRGPAAALDQLSGALNASRKPVFVIGGAIDREQHRTYSLYMEARR